jgi:hypothetical protein
MIRDRGYTGSIIQLRRAVARLRPPAREPFLKLKTFPAEQAQVDWAHFGQVAVGRARRTLSCFVATLSWSRALYLEFFFDQTMENFLRGIMDAPPKCLDPFTACFEQIGVFSRLKRPSSDGLARNIQARSRTSRRFQNQT